MHERILLHAATATVLLLGGACSDGGEVSRGTPEPTSTSMATPPPPLARSVAPDRIPEGMGSGQPDGVFPRRVVHFGGTTTIPAPPGRVVIIATGQLDAALSLGVMPVGAAAGGGAAIVPEYLKTEFPDQREDLAAIDSVGFRTEPNLEALSALRPDLILGNKAGGADFYDEFSAISPTVLTEGTGVNWKQDFLLLADALGKMGAAASFLEEYNADAAELGRAVANDPPSVSMVRFTPGRTRMFGIASFTGSIAADSGLGRPESQRFMETSQDLGSEQVGLMDGDWIFYSIQGTSEETDADAILGGPLWNSLSAVKSGQVVQVDDDPWFLNAGPTAARVVLRQLTAKLRG